MDNTLQHHGIKGQKWGVRRCQNKDGTLTNAGRRRNKYSSDDYRSAHERKSVRRMSDQELRQRINRLQMEKQYRQLSKKDISPGEKFVKDVLRESSKEVAKEYTKKWMKEGIKAMIAG